MTVRCERTLAGLASVAVVLGWCVLILAVYCVPRLAALWADLGQALSPGQRLLLAVSSLMGRGFIALTLLLATIAVFAWRIRLSGRAMSPTHKSI
jgi:type II secretory pathway component PulF